MHTPLRLVCPEGQGVMQVDPFHCWVAGHVQMDWALFHTWVVGQVMHEYPFQFDPEEQVTHALPLQNCAVGQTHELREKLQVLPPLQVMQLNPFQFCPLGHEQLLDWVNHICPVGHVTHE